PSAVCTIMLWIRRVHVRPFSVCTTLQNFWLLAVSAIAMSSSCLRLTATDVSKPVRGLPHAHDSVAEAVEPSESGIAGTDHTECKRLPQEPLADSCGAYRYSS